MVFILDDEDNDSTSGSNVGSKRKVKMKQFLLVIL